jgi:predicted ATP-dependent serine protease
MPLTGDLLGRGSEIQALDDLLDGVHHCGATLVVRGEPGVGKSALLMVARGRATGRGMQVLRASGVQSEATVPFAGLHQLLSAT